MNNLQIVILCFWSGLFGYFLGWRWEVCKTNAKRAAEELNNQQTISDNEMILISFPIISKRILRVIPEGDIAISVFKNLKQKYISFLEDEANEEI